MADDELELKQLEYPGKIQFASDRGHFPGCRFEVVHAWTRGGLVKKVNAFFEGRANRLVVDRELHAGLSGYYMTLWYTKISSEKELELQAMFHDKVKREIDQYLASVEQSDLEAREKEEEAKEAAASAEKERAEKLNKYVVLGKKCEEDHGNLTRNELRALLDAKKAERSTPEVQS